VFSADGPLLISGGAGCGIEVWNASTGRLAYSLVDDRRSWIRSLALSPDGQVLASGRGDGTVALWNLQTDQMIALSRQHSDVINSIVFSPDAQTLMTGSDDQTIQAYTLSLSSASSPIRSIAVATKVKTLLPSRQTPLLDGGCQSEQGVCASGF
jgi:WD40 repeat protein